MPYDAIRLLSLYPVRGPNFWARRPVVRLDLAVGAYDEISSAEVPGFTEALVAALPSLTAHQCSVGRPGGFVERLRDGTYAPHIIEHVALALQETMGHDVGYGRSRGGDVPGTYTVVFAHRDEAVGLRAGALALDLVRRAFAGTLAPADAAEAVGELAAIAALGAGAPTAPPGRGAVGVIVTGGRGRARAAATAALRAGGAPGPVVELEPAALLAQGLPYARAAAVLLTDAALEGVADRWRESDRAARLLGVACDALEGDGGIVVAPSAEPLLHEEARTRALGLELFAATGDAGADGAAAAMVTLSALRARRSAGTEGEGRAPNP